MCIGDSSGSDRRRRRILRRGQSLYAQGVNPGVHQIAKRRMHQAMTRQSAEACESIRDDQQAVVPPPALGTGMPGVPRRIIDHLQAIRQQRCESLANDRDHARNIDDLHVSHAGNTFLNGLTVTALYTPLTT